MRRFEAPHAVVTLKEHVFLGRFGTEHLQKEKAERGSYCTYRGQRAEREWPERFGWAQPPVYATIRACAISFARTGRTASAGTVTTETVSPAKVTNSIS
jgi:hypothetical protein